MHKENWDDLRYVLAVAETGSVSAAARQPGVNHATVLRRIAVFEDRNGQTVFTKSARGYSVPADRAAVIDKALQVRDAVLSMELSLRGTQNLLSGPVRITSTDSLCQTVLPAICSKILRKYPDLQLSLLSANSHLDLARLSADITVRPAKILEEGLVGEVAAELHFAVYDDGKNREQWLGLNGPLSRSLPAKWMEKNVPETKINQSSDSFLVLRELIAEGQGKAMLPSFLGDTDPRLNRQSDSPPDLNVGIWVASQEDLADTARFQIVRELLIEGLAKQLGHMPSPSQE